MGWWLLLAVLLFLACAALLIAEVFIPSGGILSIFSMSCLMAGLIIFFKHSTAAGIFGIIVSLVMIPTVLVMAYRLLPKTKFGKTVMLAPPKRPKGDAIPDTDRLKDMLGTVGSVITPLRPVGMADFNGHRLECVALSIFRRPFLRLPSRYYLTTRRGPQAFPDSRRTARSSPGDERSHSRTR